MKAYKRIAETAVEAVKDIAPGDLRDLAFALIMEDLMTGMDSEPIKPPKAEKEPLKLVES